MQDDARFPPDSKKNGKRHLQLCDERMSFKNFYAKNHQRYKQLYPFLKQSQLRMKIKQLWEKNRCLGSSISLPSPKHAVDASVERKRGSEDTQKGAQVSIVVTLSP